MKNVSILFSFVCVFYILFLVGCKPQTKTVNNSIHFDSIQVTKVYYLFNDTAKPGCNIQVSFIYPDSSDDAQPLNTLQNIFVEKMFGSSFRDLSPEQAVEDYCKQYIEEFEEFESPVCYDTIDDDEEDVYEDETGFASYIHLNNKLLFNHNGFVSFIVESLSYQGGAHSSRSIYGYVINLATGDFLREEQFAGNGYKANLSRLLADKIAAANELEKAEDLENLGYNDLSDIGPNDNFTLDEKGITYYFNENEIAGTMVGLTQVFIPYSELNVYIAGNSPIETLLK
ncbi:MAG: RsiV family protein [Candidatus Symbiothrix sp.]|jgi:hypothetical protein|nr:RsiV family protein [Candidatus Symbiothrix sp.]